jgi:hypothetical protein
MSSSPQVVAPATTGCWSNFTSGAGKVANWCGRQVCALGSAVWAGMQKLGQLLVNLFQRLAFFLSIGTAAAIAFVKLHAWKFLLGSVCLAAGVAIGLLAARCCGWCNKKAEEPGLPGQGGAQDPADI